MLLIFNMISIEKLFYLLCIYDKNNKIRTLPYTIHQNKIYLTKTMNFFFKFKLNRKKKITNLSYEKESLLNIKGKVKTVKQIIVKI